MLSDEREIINLCHAYAECLDRGDHRGVGSLFEHGRVCMFERGEPSGAPHVGAEGVKAFYDATGRLENGGPRTRHSITNVILGIGEDGRSASTRSYFTVLQQAPEAPLQLIASGRYFDSYGKIDGAWRFVEKLIHVDHWTR